MSEMQVGPSSLENKEGKRDKVCDFYLTPRGCIKGDKCDFQHPLTPVGVANNKVCDFYLTARGCRKGEQCDFLHPQSNQPVKDKVCTYYMTPQGCIKGLNCDFLHPRPGVYGDVGLGGGGGQGAQGGVAGMQGVSPNPGQKNKLCDFYLTPRGCVKGDKCDFIHVSPTPAFSMLGAQGWPATMPDGSQAWAQGLPEGMQAQYAGYPAAALQGSPFAVAAAAVKKKPKLCSFFKTERGCVKGETCEFIHQKDKPCDFVNKPGGCRKGAFCDFMHPAKEGDNAVAESDPGKVKTKRGGSRFEPY